jgi:hypothetical protein
MMIALNTSARGDVANLTPVKDNSLFENPSGSLSSGAGPNLFAGRTSVGGGSALRRGIVAFDFTGDIPPSSTVTAVTLTMSATILGPFAPGTTVTLHRVQADWGEGGSSGPGTGAPSQPGDATWIHRFFPSTNWGTAGGDFDPTITAAATVTGTGLVTWSSAGMLADVQSWVNSPSGNFGWIIRGDEALAGGGTGIAFASRESLDPANRPTLSVTFTPVPEPPAVGVACLMGWVIARRFRPRPLLGRFTAAFGNSRAS